MCGVQLKDRQKFMDLMQLLPLNEAMDQIALASSILCIVLCSLGLKVKGG